MSVAEHELIERRRMGMVAGTNGTRGVGADLSRQSISSFASGQPPLVIQSPSSEQIAVFGPPTNYKSAPEFPGILFYAGPLPRPAAGGALVPPHLTAEMANNLNSIDPTGRGLSPLAASLLQYFNAHARTGGTAYATGLASRDPSRPSGGNYGSDLLSKAKELVGLGGGKDSGSTPTQTSYEAPTSQGGGSGDGGGFLSYLLSPVVLIGGVLVTAGGAVLYKLSTRTKSRSRRRRR